MINILLTILTVIGYVLAFVVLLILTALLLVLLVPIRYEGQVSYRGKVLRAHAGVSWLLRLAQVLFDFKAGRGLLRIRLLGRNLKKKAFGGNKKKPSKQGQSEPAEAYGEAGEAHEMPGAEIETNTPKEAAGTSRPKASDKIPGRETEPVEGADKPPEEKFFSEQPDEQKQEQAEDQAKENKLAALREKYRAAKEFLEDEENQRTLRLLFHSLKSVLRHLLPTYFELKGVIGFSDPALTGRVIGLIYMLQAVYGDSIEVKACFEESIVEGEMRIKGRIRLGMLAVIAVRVLLNRNFRRLLRKLKEGKNG